MGTNFEAAKRRVKKLLALSKSPDENEAVAVLKKAWKIMEEYRLTEGQCLYTRQPVKATIRLSPWRWVLANAAAWLYYCEAFRDPAHGEIDFFGESFDVFMAGEMYRYLSKTIERMAKQNIRKSAKRPYREKYKLGIACQLNYRIRELGAVVSWAPERERKLLAVKKAMESEIAITRGEIKLSESGAAFIRGAAFGKGVSLSRQATGHGGRYLEEGK